MKRLLIVGVAAAAALTTAGCDVNSGTESWKNSLGPRIKNHADEVCKTRGGTANTMLATDRFDDGMVTCKDGTNHVFDL